jgi:hypothetical protein
MGIKASSRSVPRRVESPGGDREILCKTLT